MVAPTINTITPAVGLSLGETFVVIAGTDFNDEASGGTIKVLFGTVESPEYGVVDDTKVIALTPGGIVGTVDVTVENIPASGPAEPTTVVDGFKYGRPDLSTPDNESYSAVTVVTRALIADLRRTVIENVHHNMHPDYVDAFSALDAEEVQESRPSLRLTGPTIQEDRFHALNGRFNVQTTSVPGTFDVHTQPVTVRLDYQYVGVARSSGEATKLWAALSRYFNRTPNLVVPVDGNDPANGTIEFEMNVVWEQRGDFRAEATRQAIYQFNGAINVRGVHAVAGKVGEGQDTLDEPIITVIPL